MKIVRRASSAPPRQGGFAANPIVAALRKLLATHRLRKTSAGADVGAAASSTLCFESLEPRLLLSAELLPHPGQLS
ncbi:MAG: LEPR-XLL domain-containing protein, partial [Candidatus Accumulibacter sp.]|nr:LEPR-XLL domain-containing protein [Accumulibacter sp.]